MKAGVEIEFWVIDENGGLRKAKPISDRVYFASQEFSKAMIEIQTSPHDNIEDLLEELISKTEMLAELAKKDGRRIVPLGTPLNSGEVEVYESERYEIEKKVIGDSVLHAGRTAGLHIHFEQNNVLEQLNRLLSLDPALSLVNSSPYYQGEPLADGSRNKVYRYWACGDFPEQRQLWSYFDSVEEWREKRKQLFEKFRDAAEKSEVDIERFERYFDPESSVWTPVRLREDYPTVEWRAPDTTMMTEAVKLIRECWDYMQRDFEGEKDYEFLRSTSDKAIEEGRKSVDVRDYLEEIGFDHGKFSPVSESINEGDNLEKSRARRIRTDYAKRLFSDLEEAKNLVK